MEMKNILVIARILLGDSIIVIGKLNVFNSSANKEEDLNMNQY